jgi:hypothetical protein
MSELHILQEFMHRLEAQTGGKALRPCDYFDLIVAVDAAGYVGEVHGADVGLML